MFIALNPNDVKTAVSLQRIHHANDEYKKMDAQLKQKLQDIDKQVRALDAEAASLESESHALDMKA